MMAHQIWINGPRILMIFIFLIAIIGKIINPEIFFTMTTAAKLSGFVPEFLFSFSIAAEILMIVLLIIRPMYGLLISSGALTIFTFFILWLYSTGFSENCGCFGNFMILEVGPSKILQNIGLILLLLSSWWIRRGD